MAAIFADDIFKLIFINEKFCISIRTWLKFVAKSPIDIGSGNSLALNRCEAWTNADPFHWAIYLALVGDEF